jgi:adenylyltransferase/sulfurtransferase
VIHSTKNLSLPKSQSAADFISSLNPNVKVTTHETRLTQSNAKSLISGYDVVIDGSDNALTRYITNDACVVLKKPLVSSASVKWEGQVTVYNYQEGPCYKCLYPQCPPSGSMMSCSGSGVFGPAPGIVGMIAVTECAKLIIGKGELLVGKMLLIDLLNLRFKVVKVRSKVKTCFCADFRSETMKKEPSFDFEKFDYDKFVGNSCKYSPPDLEKEHEIHWKELGEKLAQIKDKSKINLVDVRNSNHHGIFHVKEIESIGVEHLPLGQVRSLTLNEIKEKYPNSEKVYIFCRSGRTSKEATAKMRNAGVPAINVIGGVLKLMKERKFDEEFIKNL